MLHTAQTTKLPPPPIASTLDELLAYHDQQFVLCAFQTLLGREPDPEGLGYYVGRLRRGFSKMLIVAQLRLSKEGKARAKEGKLYAKKGKAHTANLPGLDKSIKRYQRGQYLLIGWLFRWVYGAESNHPAERRLRAIENKLFSLSDESTYCFNQLETVLAGLNQLVVTQNQSVVAALTSKPVVTPDQLERGFEGLHQLVIEQTQSVVAALGNTPMVSPSNLSIQASESEGLKQLSIRAQEIYFQLKSAVVIHAERAA